MIIVNATKARSAGKKGTGQQFGPLEENFSLAAVVIEKMWRNPRGGCV